MGEMTDEEMDWEFECAERLMGEGNKNAGQLITTQSGLIGRTYNKDPQVDGKIMVYTPKGNLLCRPETLTLNGFID
jgi:hypothetical protein